MARHRTGPELAPTVWRQWRFDWQATPGRHRLQVCAEGRDGSQPTRHAPPYPAGATGLHTITVSIAPATEVPGTGAFASRAIDRILAQARARTSLAAGGLAAWGWRPADGGEALRSNQRPRSFSSDTRTHHDLWRRR